MAVFCLTGSFTAVKAQTFKHDFLYKFLSRWTDVATDGSYLYVTNSAYSQIDRYTIAGKALNLIWGGVGSGDGQMRQPMGLTFDTNPHGGVFYLYVADTGNNRITRYNASTGVPVDPAVGQYGWGSYGSGDGQLNHPEGVAVYNKDNTDNGQWVFIADTGNNRIQALDTIGGTFYATGSATAKPGIGINGQGVNEMSSPRGIAVMPDTDPNLIRVFVADTGNNRIVFYLFDKTTNKFTYQTAFGSYGVTSDSNNIRFNQPNKITIDGGGNIFVTDTTNRIQKFNNGRSFQGQWNAYSLKGTTGLTTFGSTLYVVEPAGMASTISLEQYNEIEGYATSTGNYNDFNLTGEPNQPVDIALDSSGNIYMTNSVSIGSTEVSSVIKFNSSWIPQYEWSGHGSTFSHALGIGVNTGGEVCVADTGNNRVQRFDTNGGYVSDLPVPQETPASFNSPKDVANEATGKMYVADTDNNRIVKYSSDFPAPTEIWAIGQPTPVFTIPSGGTPTPTTPAGPYFDHPYGVTLDAVNKIYVADSGHGRILKFDANGNLYTDYTSQPPFLGFWGEYGSADNLPQPQFDNPEGMAIGPEPTGYIYVADTGNNRIQRFDQAGTLSSRVLWGQYGTADGYFSQPRNVAVDSSSRVYVSEVTNRRVQVFGDATTNAGLNIVETGGTAVTEDGSVYDSYTVRLSTQPSSNVTVTVTASDSAQLSVSSPSLTFTPTNWNVPQVETVIPIHDYVDQPTTQHIVITHTVASSDTHYQSNGISLGNVDVTLTDTDTVGTVVTPTGLSLAENGNGGNLSDTYSVTLTSKPTAPVTITATSTNGYTSISPASQTIQPAQWNTSVSFTVTAIHDFVANGSHTDHITNSITTSDTSGYQTVSVAQVQATIADNVDSAGVILDQYKLGPIDEGGTGATYSVVLKSKPVSDVAINVVTKPGTTDLVFSPTSVTFTPANWSTPQSVTVTAPRDFMVNDPLYDLRVVYATNSAAISNTDPNYQPGAVQFYVGTSIGDGTVETTIRDVDHASLAFTEVSGTQYVIEGQTTDTYTVALTSKPSSNVTLTSSSDTEATSSAHVFRFTPANWNVPQNIVISAPNDNIDEGTHSAYLTFTIAPDSLDQSYVAGNSYVSPTFTIYDTDYAGIAFNLPNGVINVQEGGYDDQYFMHLKTQPLANVTVNISGGADATVTPSSLTFTPADWNQDQIATVSAINNFIVQGTHTATLTHTTVSTDPQYNRLSTPLTINVADDDNTVPGVLIIQTDGSTTVKSDGTQDTYTMQLTSRPTANVRIRVLGDNWSATTSAALFTFTALNWNIPQTVHVLPKNTAGTTDLSDVFHHLVTSLDPHYNGIAVDDVFITVLNLSKPSASTALAPTCGQTAPADTPNLFQIDAGANSATLFFTPIKDNINYYFVAYGYKPGDMRFGVSFPYGPYNGVIDYTVNMLDSSKTYYFMVRGGNGCATGNWSNSLAATTAASGSASLRSYYGGGTSGYTTGSYSGGAITSGTSTDGSHPIFARDLYPGMSGADVRSLQMYLNQKGFIVAQSGAGSPGNETMYYGSLTANAIRRFQEAHYAEILSPLGYSSGTGIFGPSTRAYVNSH